MGLADIEPSGTRMVCSFIHVYCLIPRGPPLGCHIGRSRPFAIRFSSSRASDSFFDASRHSPLTISNINAVACSVDQHDVGPDYELHGSSSESNSDSDQLAPLKTRESEHGHGAPPPHDAHAEAQIVEPASTSTSNDSSQTHEETPTSTTQTPTLGFEPETAALLEEAEALEIDLDAPDERPPVDTRRRIGPDRRGGFWVFNGIEWIPEGSDDGPRAFGPHLPPAEYPSRPPSDAASSIDLDELLERESRCTPTYVAMRVVPIIPFDERIDIQILRRTHSSLPSKRDFVQAFDDSVRVKHLLIPPTRLRTLPDGQRRRIEVRVRSHRIPR